MGLLIVSQSRYIPSKGGGGLLLVLTGGVALQSCRSPVLADGV